MEFKHIDKKYRFVPFWSWNEKLNEAETAEQIKIMDEVGIGGYFMHARGGLQTEYMGEEWFKNAAVGIEEGKNRNMECWAYDENGWPSGFGNGYVNGRGTIYQQKYLRVEKGEKHNNFTIANIDGNHYYYDVNPYYVDVLDAKVVKCFIEEIYLPYYERFGDSFEGFFTDEPQISRNGIPWSFILIEEYEKAYNENLTVRLNELFFNVGEYKDTRIKFWKLVTQLFSKNFMKQIYDWCDERNLKLTGHLVLEETLRTQLTANGACMPHYEYFHMPGMDWLSRRNQFECFTPLQLSSAANQLGKKQILSETFACCGHGVDFDELKQIAQWQMVHGITKICPHLEGYSLRGLRKRDHPPAIYYQQPWWEEYPAFIEAMSRIGMLMEEGEVHFDTLLLHNQTSAWAVFDGNENNAEIEKLNESLKGAMLTLEKKHICFHFGDEILFERHARVEAGVIICGTQRYTRVVVPEYTVLLKNTERLLDEFKKSGGDIVTAGEAEPNNICDNENLTYTMRHFKDFEMHFFVNKSNEEFTAKIAKGNKKLDILSGDVTDFDGVFTFKPHECLIAFDNGETRKTAENKPVRKTLDISGEWEVADYGMNILTIDKCDVYFDGKLCGENENAADVIHMAYALKRNVHVRCDYKFIADYVPNEIYLVCETPELFKITVNEKEISKKITGYFVDKSFIKLELDNTVIIGKNVISFELDFVPSAETIKCIEKSLLFESEKNKLTFDTEIESIYIIGKFSVRTDGKFEKLDKNAVRYDGEFVIDKPIESIGLDNIEQQGFPFYAGRVAVKKDFDLETADYKLKFGKKGINAVKIKVNDKAVRDIYWEPYECDISDYLHKGRNMIELTLVNNLRNMLGAHHLPEGECYGANPNNFYHNPCVWSGMKELPWDERYCFIETGIRNEE